MSVSAASPKTLKAEIIALAKSGKRPREIADQFVNLCEYNYVANVIAQARRDGEEIPFFQHQTRRKPQEVVKPKAATPPAALDYFELRALKKLLGEDLKEIEADADLEGLSLAAYVREVLLDHARKIRE